MSAPQPSAGRHSPMRTFAGLALALVLAAGAGAALYWFTRVKTDSGLSATKLESNDSIPKRSQSESSKPGESPWFRDVTADSGIHFTYRNGEEADQFTILETLGGGVGLIDYDGDGLLDLFVTGGGTFAGPDKNQIKGLPCRLYKNLGGCKFKDATADAGLEQVAWWYTHGVAVGDFNRDGWPDLLVTGYGAAALFRNEAGANGSRRFVDITAKVGLHVDGWTTGAGWADLHGTGFADLYVCRYADWSFKNHPVCVGQLPGVERDVCPPHRFRPQKHVLFRNDQGRAFVNLVQKQGFEAEGYGLGLVLADLNDDGRPDIYVANDMSNNLLFTNRGDRLEERGLIAGVARDDAGRTTASMGVDAADYNGSGRPSLLITNFQRELPSLYRNLGRELFLYDSTSTGLGAAGRAHVGWGTRFCDVDNDGWEDLIMVHGHLFRRPAGASIKQKPLLLRNVEHQGRRYFREWQNAPGAFFQTPACARGLAASDLDNDGWPDLVVSNVNSPIVLLRNEGAAKAHWLGVQLVGRDHRDVIGSTVILEDGARKLTRFAKGGGSYLSASDPRLLFGLGSSERACKVTVKWSWGGIEAWENLQPDHYYELREGLAAAKRTFQKGQ